MLNKNFKFYKYKKILILSTFVIILIASFSIFIIINHQSDVKQIKIIEAKQENIKKLAAAKAVVDAMAYTKSKADAKVSQLTNKSSENNKSYSVLKSYKMVLQNKVNFFSVMTKEIYI